jgi:hypothetical protein
LQRRQLGYIRETPHCDMLRIFDLVRWYMSLKQGFNFTFVLSFEFWCRCRAKLHVIIRSEWQEENWAVMIYLVTYLHCTSIPNCRILGGENRAQERRGNDCNTLS